MDNKKLSKQKIGIFAAIIILLAIIISSCGSDKEPVITNEIGIFKLKQLSYKIEAGDKMIKATEKACIAYKEKGCEDRVEKMKERFDENIKKEKKEIYEQFGDK
jgi:hypothetical protein